MHTKGHTIRLGSRRYRLREQIGSSSYGEVWSAVEGILNRSVAIKFVRADIMRGAPAATQQGRWTVEGIAKESAFLSGLGRDERRHIVRLIDQGEWEGLPVLVMELMEGNLKQHVAELAKRGTTPSPGQIIGWLEQINAGLAVVHRHGMRYLDLKPENVLCTAQGKRLKLGDFGGLRTLGVQAGHSYCGTPAWQAPEQCIPTGRDSHGYLYVTDHRSDYFALGMLFYSLVGNGMPLRFAHECQALRERLAVQLPRQQMGKPRPKSESNRPPAEATAATRPTT